MFSKKIKKECEPSIAATVEMSQESQRGFKVFAIFATVLVEYMVNHHNIFQHFRRNDSHDKKAKVYEENMNILRSKLQSGEIQPSKPEVLSVASYAKIIHKCPRSILETACYLAEDYNLQRNAYWGSGRTLPEPVRPGEEECRRLKVKNIKRVMKHKRMTFPFIEHNHLYARRINLSSVNSSDLTHFNVDETYVEQYNGTVRIVIYPVMFIDKRFFYCLHDIRVMGIDLGVNTDATCAIYDNSTGKCTLKQIRLPVKDKILQLQNQYKHTNNKETKESLRREIHALNEAYRKELAKAICQYAVENKVEFVFLEGLQKYSPKDETVIFWNPKSTLEVIYSKLHESGIAYRSVSAANTSQYYHKGGYVERDKNNYSNIKNMEVITMNKYDIQRARVENIKRMYPPGTRIELISMSDPYAPVPSGTKGTVSFVDDMGTIHPKWDNGRSLGVVVGEDEFRKLSQSEIEAEQQALDEKSEQSNSSDEPDETGGMNMTM